MGWRPARYDDLTTCSTGLGADTGPCKPEVSRIRADLDADAAALRNRPLAAR